MDFERLCGWDRRVARVANATAPAEYTRELKIVGIGPISKRMFFFEIARKVLGGMDIYDYSLAHNEDVTQDIGDCKIAGTKVLKSDGTWKNIEDIQIGEYVISHLGNPKRVKRTINKKYTGKLYTIQADGHYNSVTSTEDHQYPAYSNSTLYDYAWKSARELKVEVDSIVIPYGIQNDCYQYVEFNNKKILVDEDFATIIGWYLAEGGISYRELKDGVLSYQKVTFNLSIDENDVADNLINKLSETFGVVGVKQYHKEDKNVLLVEVYNVNFSTFLHKLVPGNVYSKRIPSVLINSPFSIKLALLRAWLAGDGHVTENHIQGTSSSYNLIQDMFHLSVSCGLSPRVKYIPKEDHQNVDPAIMTFRGNSYSTITRLPLSARNLDYGKYKYVRLSNIGLLRNVTDISSKNVEDEDVYCIEVEDDGSFIANGYATSNCVSWGAKHALEYLQCFSLYTGGWDEFKVIFSPYLYGCGRVYIGGVDLSQDGSCGINQAQAVVKYGSVPTDLPNLPKYNANVARQFGRSKSILDRWGDEGRKHLVKSTAKVSTWDQCVQAIINGYPVTVASSVGYEMLPRSDGFHHKSGSWPHQMCIIGVDDEGNGIDSHGIIANNWGDVHGSLVDLRDPTIKLPPGVLRVRAEDIQTMLDADDSFAYSGYDGFVAQITPDDFASI
jgi:intein/homing endonuclease